jgi:hypothetical protein
MPILSFNSKSVYFILGIAGKTIWKEYIINGMAKSKIFDKMQRFVLLAMPKQWQKGLLAWILRTWYKPPALVFPWKKQGIKKALVMLPEDPVEAFHQINNYLQIAALYRSTSFFLLCTGKVGAFFKHVHPEATIVEYDPSQRFLFSRQFSEQGRVFSREEFDLCVVLERTPELSLLFLAGKTAAPIRAGYTEAGAFPFLNMHVNPSKEQRYRTEQNCVMARALGASDGIRMNWSIAKETMEEISHMVRELHVAPSARLVGIDVGLFFSAFGPDWTEMLCNKLKENKTVSYYCYVDEEPDETISPFLSLMEIPVFSNLSPSRCAALIAKSTGIISGRSVFFELANALKKPIIGVFEETECAAYCQGSVLTKAITYSTAPDSSVIEKIVLYVNNPDATRKA